MLEHVQMRVYDLLGGADKRETTGRQAVYPTSAAAHVEALAAERAAKEALSVRLAEVQAKAEGRAHECEDLRMECRKLRMELGSYQSAPEGQARAQLVICEKQLEASTAKENAQARELTELKASVQSATRAAEEATAKAGYLQSDKEYLSVSLKGMEERLGHAEQRLSKEEMERGQAVLELNRTKVPY